MSLLSFDGVILMGGGVGNILYGAIVALRGLFSMIMLRICIPSVHLHFSGESH